jgi:hypothetical protein
MKARSTAALIVALAAAVAAAPAGAATPACTGGEVGTSGRDVITGGRGADRIRGLSGNDVLRSDNDDLRSSSARDCLDGGSGRDHLFGGFGRDLLVGGPGADVIYGEYAWTNARSGGGGDRVLGGAGDDLIHPGAGVNDVDAGTGNDSVDAANGRTETVRCGAGRDRVAADFADRLIGCERVRRLVSPFAQVLAARGGYVVRWRTLERVSTAAPEGGGFGEEELVATVQAYRSRRCRDRGAVATTKRSYAAGATIALRLKAPGGGWCPGLHRVVIRDRYVEDLTAPEGDSCDTFESGSSQCESPAFETEDHDDLFDRATFRVR